MRIWVERTKGARAWGIFFREKNAHLTSHMIIFVAEFELHVGPRDDSEWIARQVDVLADISREIFERLIESSRNHPDTSGLFDS